MGASKLLPVVKTVQYLQEYWVTTKFDHLLPSLGVKAHQCCSRVSKGAILLQQTDTVGLYLNVGGTLTEDIWEGLVKETNNFINN